MNLPEAGPLMMVAAAQLAAAVLASIPEALLLRRLAFRTAAMVSVGSFMIYPPIAIGLAVYFDMGAWAVVIGQALRPVAKFFFGLIAARWRPHFVFDWSMVKGDIAFNGGFFLVAGTGFLIKNMDYWVVSRFLGGALLGVYYIAFVIPTIVRQRLTWALGRVLLPVLSRVRDDRDRFVRAFVDTSQFISLITMPAMVGLLLVAEPVVHVVLGARWADAVAPLGILALAAAWDSMAQVPLQGFVAEGTPMRAFLFAGPRVIVLAVGLTIAISGPGTLVAVAWAVFASSLTNFVLAQIVAITRMSIPAGRLIAGYRPVVVPVVAMAAAVGGTALVFDRIDVPQIVELVILLLVGGVSYLGVGMVFSRRVFRRLLHDGKVLIGRGKSPASGEPAGAPAA
jgi:PST family polysaccharide transporter